MFPRSVTGVRAMCPRACVTVDARARAMSAEGAPPRTARRKRRATRATCQTTKVTCTSVPTEAIDL
eukprot:9276068-Lingulodinium_polyedra.AAC.1